MHGLVFAAHVRGLRYRFYPPSASWTEPHTPRPAKAGRQEPRKLLFPGAILAHLPLTMLCPPGADVGESMYPIPEGDGFYSSPTPPRFYNTTVY